MASERERAKEEYLVLREKALKVEKKYSLIKMLSDILYMLCGGVIIGAIFMATDYVTSPPTPWGKAIFGIGCGLLTCLIRYFGNLPEGVSYAILFMNILNPYIIVWTKRKVFGAGGAK